jgi:phage regulator Rha-like protein
MNELVFLEPNRIDAVPFTTSDVIAETTGITHRRIKSSIVKNISALETFGKVVQYGATLGGRGNEAGYQLSEQQATLLITFLKNTPAVVAFKTELVRQFYLMREELFKRQVSRQELKPIRRELTDVIQEKSPDAKWAYKQYTDLAYKAVLGKIAAQVRKERNAKNTDVAIDYMTSDEIRAITKLQNQIAVLVDMGMDYHQIKSLLLNKALSVRIA